MYTFVMFKLRQFIYVLQHLSLTSNENAEYVSSCSGIYHPGLSSKLSSCATDTRTYSSYLSISQNITDISLSLLPKENELMFRTMFLVEGNQDTDIETQRPLVLDIHGFGNSVSSQQQASLNKKWEWLSDFWMNHKETPRCKVHLTMDLRSRSIY